MCITHSRVTRVIYWQEIFLEINFQVQDWEPESSALMGIYSLSYLEPDCELCCFSQSPLAHMHIHRHAPSRTRICVCSRCRYFSWHGRGSDSCLAFLEVGIWHPRVCPCSIFCAKLEGWQHCSRDRLTQQQSKDFAQHWNNPFSQGCQYDQGLFSNVEHPIVHKLQDQSWRTARKCSFNLSLPLLSRGLSQKKLFFLWWQTTNVVVSSLL